MPKGIYPRVKAGVPNLPHSNLLKKKREQPRKHHKFTLPSSIRDEALWDLALACQQINPDYDAAKHSSDWKYIARYAKEIQPLRDDEPVKAYLERVRRTPYTVTITCCPKMRHEAVAKIYGEAIETIEKKYGARLFYKNGRKPKYLKEE